MTLLTFFLVFDAILSLRVSPLYTSFAVALVSLALFFQGFWSITLKKTVTSELMQFSAVMSLAMGEMSLVLYFWPVSVVVGSLFLTSFSYMLLGLGQTYFEGKLFPQTVKEYITVGALVFIGMFFATSWS